MASLFFWTESGGTDRAFVTELGVEFLAPTHEKTRLPARSLDGSIATAITIGSGQTGRRLAIRHDAASQLMEDLREAGEDRLSITLVPEVTEQAVAYTVKLFDFGDVQREQQTGIGLQRFMLEFTALRLDGGALP